MNFSIQPSGNTPTDEKLQNQQPYNLKYFMQTINNASIKLISSCPSKESLKEKLKNQRKLMLGTLAVGTLGALSYLLISYFNSQPQILEKITPSQNSQTDLSQKINQQSQTVLKETPQDTRLPFRCFSSQPMLKDVAMNEPQRIRLDYFMSMPQLKKQEIIERFELQDSINCFGKDFETRFKQLDPYYLERLTLTNLKYDDNWTLRYKLFTAEEIGLLKVESLKKLSSSFEEGLFTKLKALPKTPVLDIDLPEEISQLSIGKFINLSGNQLTRYIPQLSLDAFFLISIDQLNDLDFSKVNLTIEEVGKIFGQQTKKWNQIESLSIKTLNVIINKIHKTLAQIYVTDEQFNQLDHTKISAERFQHLIEVGTPSPNHRLSMLTSDQLNQNLDKLKKEYFSRFPSEKIQFLDISKMNKDQLRVLYKIMPKELNVLSEASFKIFMDKMSDWHTYLIPVKFWHLIDFKNMSTEEFKNFMSENSITRKNVEKLSPDQSLAVDQLLSKAGYSFPS